MTALTKQMQVWHAAVVLVWLVVPQLYAPLRVWPLYLLVPLAGYAVTVGCVAPLRRSIHWLRLGRSGWDVLGATLMIIIVASTALLLWYVFREPDLSKVTERLTAFPYPSLVLFAVVFSIFNALLEEILFRGILYEALDAEFGLWPAILTQGVFFGIVHAQGIPSGLLGVLLASSYGVLLGWLRHLSGGLLWSFIAHIFADATIFLIVMHEMGARLE
jgi:uncharacterized protein